MFKKLPKGHQEQVRDQKMLAYFDEKMLNLVAQFRGLAIASGVTPEAFFEAFTDEEKQKQYFDRLHKYEDEYNKKVEAQEQAKIAPELLGNGDPKAIHNSETDNGN